MENILTNLEALASGVGKQDEATTMSFYNIASNQLKTEEERIAFKYGALAVFCDAGKMRIRRTYYTHKFKKAIKNLEGEL